MTSISDLRHCSFPPHGVVEYGEAQRTEITDESTLGEVDAQPHFFCFQLSIDAREVNFARALGPSCIVDIWVWKLAV